MELVPKRTSLADATAAVLKEWIRTGILTETLPGERELKARLRVSRETLRLALKQLAGEGWVIPARKGQQRRVQVAHLPPQPAAAANQLPVSFLSPYSPVHRATLAELEDLQMRLAEQGRPLQFMSPHVFHLRHPDRQLERLVRKHPSAAWILCVACHRPDWLFCSMLPFYTRKPSPQNRRNLTWRYRLAGLHTTAHS